MQPVRKQLISARFPIEDWGWTWGWGRIDDSALLPSMSVLEGHLFSTEVEITVLETGTVSEIEKKPPAIAINPNRSGNPKRSKPRIE